MAWCCQASYAITRPQWVNSSVNGLVFCFLLTVMWKFRCSVTSMGTTSTCLNVTAACSDVIRKSSRKLQLLVNLLFWWYLYQHNNNHHVRFFLIDKHWFYCYHCYMYIRNNIKMISIFGEKSLLSLFDPAYRKRYVKTDVEASIRAWISNYIHIVFCSM